jgi:hypothetical protein
MAVQPYLSYYKKHQISPITKKIENKDQFFMQRSFLYRSLGLPNSLKTLDVIEFGPGNGVNAVYTNSLHPSKYVLVDGNPTGMRNVRANLATHYSDLTNIETHECLFQDFHHKPLYDLVICENALQGQDIRFVKMISDNVKMNGVLCITCNDAASILSETLRSLVGWTLSQEIDSFDKKVELLVGSFSKHLDSLKFVGRSYADWVCDSILHRIHLDLPLHSIGDVLSSLSDHFVFQGSSPRFMSDFRWYRSVGSMAELAQTNALAKEAYLTNIVNLMDCRAVQPPHSTELGANLIRCSESIKTLASQYSKSFKDEDCALIQEALLELAAHLKTIAPNTAAALEGYYDLFKKKQFASGLTDSRLVSWWGRATQYLTLAKYS